MSDAVGKVGDGTPVRNNRIRGDDFLNRSCAFGGRLESMLLGDPPQNRFSTVSVSLGKSHTEHVEFASPPESGHRADMPAGPRCATSGHPRNKNPGAWSGLF